MDIENTAKNAWKSAIDEAFAKGLSVVISDDGTLYEVSPDGSRVKIKDIDPWIDVSRKNIEIPIDNNKTS